MNPELIFGLKLAIIPVTLMVIGFLACILDDGSNNDPF